MILYNVSESQVVRSNADDIRTLGWSVAVHNDYRVNGKPFTFWLFTKGDRCVKGEGPTDAIALDIVRTQLCSEDFCGRSLAASYSSPNVRATRRQKRKKK